MTNVTESLPFDVTAARRHLRKDRQLAALMKRIGPFGMTLKRPPSTFHALAEAITYQQLTGKAAATIFGRVLDGKRVLRAADVAKRSDDQLRAAGLSRAKTAAFRDLATRAVNRQIPSLGQLQHLDDPTIIARLTAVRGIGRWTVEMLLIFTLGRPDVLPAADYGVQKGYANAFSTELPTPKQLAAHAERWSPYRSVASWYLWRAADQAG